VLEQYFSVTVKKLDYNDTIMSVTSGTGDIMAIWFPPNMYDLNILLQLHNSFI